MVNIVSLARPTKILIYLAVALIVIGGVSTAAYYWHYQDGEAAYATAAERDNEYVRFDMEGYDRIMANYWQASTTYDLPRLFQQSLAKASGKAPLLPSDDRSGTAAMLASIIPAGGDASTSRALALGTLQVVLYNLRPNGRSSLDSSAQVTALRQDVSNVNPSHDLYDDLGVSASSSESAIEKSYDEKLAALPAGTSSAPVRARLTYAYDVLSRSRSRLLYDQSGAEPTVFDKIIGATLYIYLEKMSPTTVQEFAWAVDAASTTPGLDSMIIDVRGNVGGSPETVQGILGLFIGNNQYAFDFYHQGDYQVQRTIFGTYPELGRYKEIAILTDRRTQSSAELLTEVLTHFNLARSVGTTTAGWGTIENTYPLRTPIDATSTYDLFLVNSLTLRGDGQPIQGNGVTPDVDIDEPGWRSELGRYFDSSSLIRAIEETASTPPVEY